VTDSADIVLTHDDFTFALDARDGVTLARFGLGGASWIDPAATSPLFTVQYDGKGLDGRTAGLSAAEIETSVLDDGSRQTTVHLAYEPDHLTIDLHLIAYADTALVEQWIVVRNAGSRPVRVDRLDSLVLDVPAAPYELMSYSSAWGLEFAPEREPVTGEAVLETRKGRSSNQRHPWFALFRGDGAVLSASVMWSGNWVFRFEPRDGGGYRISGGLHDWEFFKDLKPGEEIESAHVAFVLGNRADLNDVSAAYASIGRQHWYPQNQLSETLPVEWNHWWPYFDHSINEEVFRRNVDEAARLGCEVCTLDAGWFGPTDPSSHWYDYRGDWDLVNSVRFPSGVRALADYTHARGMKFGLWCEIEGLGQHAHLAEAQPQLVARRDGERLGYVCLGGPAGQEWAYATLDRLITDYACDWVKLDFNLDPGAGCNRTDHGHGAGDGLFEHYRGYYWTLQRIRERHPGVILENCSAGGLRIDLGLAQQTHFTFLSDPDWPEHDLQIFWGASTMLAPEVCLHWGWCERAENKHPHQTFNPCDPNLQPHQLDYAVRNGMLGAFGYSQKLPDLPAWVAERLAFHARTYKDLVRRFVRSGTLHRLTAQPQREGLGDRWAGFQYALPDGSEQLLFAFRLDGGAPERTLHLQNLDPERRYTLSWLDAGTEEQRTGAALMEKGIHFTQLPEEGSEIIHIR
jgi:alpha-galactosidase